ncbi:MAG: hypothetical protein WDZ93_01485 [Candidatus Paceibacterota bacterium]
MIRTQISTAFLITVGIVTSVTLAVLSTTFVERVAAHSSGASIEQTIDGYLVDIGYSPEEPRSGEQIRFDFYLYDAETDTQVPFTDIWFRLEDDGRLLYAGGLAKAEFGATGMTIAFPEAGTYTGFARFSNEGEALVEIEFTLSVQQGDVSGAGTFSFLALGVGVVAGALLSLVGIFLFIRTRRNTSGNTAPVTEESETTPKRPSRTNLIVSVAVGLACAAAAFYVTLMLLSDNQLNASAPEQAAIATDGTVSVVLTDEGFEPAKLTVARGATVEFSTTTGRPFWPASNLHPTHGIYPEFDSLEPIPPEETWSFTFDRVGTWNMHDHIRSYFTGTIHVVE